MTIRPEDEAAALEQTLGDPTGPGPLGLADLLALDEAETFPQQAWDRLVALGYFQHLVPAELGGALDGFDRLLAVGRVVARRDLSAAIATGQCLLGALPIFLGGSDAQRADVAAMIGRGEAGSLALTEEAHGSDLAANRTRAWRDGDGFVLDGTKWAINNATRGRYQVVHARTDDAGGPRGFSLFFVDKHAVDPRSLEPLPKLRTHGIRGADISGMRFVATRLPETALVGREGHGLDLVLRTMQVSRTMCAAFSLGAADTALRMAIDFARGRALYESTAWALPTVQDGLREAFVALLLADALARLGVGALATMPETMSVLSAAVKMLVPSLGLEVVSESAVVLGARHYLREGPYAAFTKLSRDASLVPLFDGSTSVNRAIVAGQLARIAAARPEEIERGALAMGARARAAVDPRGDRPVFDRTRLRTSARGADDALSGLDDSVARLRVDGIVGHKLRARAEALLLARDALDRRIGALESRGVAVREPVWASLADQYAWLVAGAAVVHLVACERPLEGALGDGAAASLALRRVLRELGAQAADPLLRLDDPVDREAEARLGETLLALFEGHRLFGFVPFALGGSPGFGPKGTSA